MTGKSITSRILQELCASNGVAALATPDIRAVIYVEPRGEGAALDYIALLPDGRFRSGQVTIYGERAYASGLLALNRPGPTDERSLAVALIRAIDHRDSLGVLREGNRPFTAFGWTPWKAGTHSKMSLLSGLAEYAVLPWLHRTPVSEDGCFDDAWQSTLAGHVTSEQLAAAEAFAGINAFEPAAFDEACGATLGGARIRAFARNNAVIAPTVLSNPATRALVAGGAGFDEVLDGLPPDEPLLRPAYGSSKVRRRVLAALSGIRCDELGHGPMADLVLSAMEALPAEWLPRTEDDLEAFLRLCRGTLDSYCLRLPGGVPADWWRKPFSGSGGHWAAFAERVVQAGLGNETFGLQSDTVLRTASTRRAFVVDDLFLPLARMYGAESMLALSGMDAEWMGSLRAMGKSALHDFGDHVLTDGMDLPAVAAQAGRHRDASAGIMAVFRRYPVPGEVLTEAEKTIHELSEREMPPGVVIFSALKRSYDTNDPVAVEAMSQAWGPVLPRRLRRLSARELAVALDAEAALYLAGQRRG